MNENIAKKIVNNVMKLLTEGYQRQANVFDVLEMLPQPVDFSNATSTSHWRTDREDRSRNYDLSDKGEGVYSFIVNTGHPNGNEIHTITEKAFIIIQNERTKRIVTVLAARPGQIKRYWLRRGNNLPTDQTFRYILNNSYNNVNRGLNNL